MSIQKEKIIIFYSWQSDLPNRTNRGFIEDCLKKAVKELHADEEISVEPVIDRDTKGIPGSPNISDTILDKIDASHIYIGDVSIINTAALERKTPNPNVLIELGYALKSVGHDNVIMVNNLEYGEPSDLPFDLKQKRILTYNLPEDADKKAEQKKLITILSKALKTIIQSSAHMTGAEDRSTIFQEARDAILNDDTSYAEVAEDCLDNFILHLSKYSLYPVDEKISLHKQVLSSINNVLPLRDEYIDFLLLLVTRKDAPNTYELLHEFLERLLPLTLRPKGASTWNDRWSDNFKFIVLELFLYTIAVLIKRKKYKSVDLFLNTPYLTIDPNRESYSDYCTCFLDIPIRTLEEDDEIKRLLTNEPEDNVAHLIKDRVHPKISFDDVLLADFIIMVRYLLSDQSNFRWYPKTSVFYVEYGVLELFEKAKSLKHFEKIKPLLGVNDNAELIEHFSNNLLPRVRKFNSMEWVMRNPFERLMGINQLGTLP